jgi:adenine-specific DNA-methyltransferase
MPKKPGKKRTVGGSAKGPSPVEAIRHKDTRVNIPTHELRDFVKDDEVAPKTLLYPRDPSLDPQLVWKGKDEQDRQDLAVPVVPIYIQEKIHPQALVENLRETAKKGEPEPELSLFADFNGITDFDKKVDFYHHEGRWSNRMILGDSLLVMTSLAEKEGLKGRVQCVFFDPPYGIDFGSNWQVSTRKRIVQDGKPEHASREPEVVKAFRDTWTLRIHSYLSYLRDRLTAARELLTETGSVFVQIGEENVHVVRSVLDEVFGADNFMAQVWFRKKTMPLGTRFLEGMGDYLLWFAKQKEDTNRRPVAKYRKLFRKMDYGPDSGFPFCELPDGRRLSVGDAIEAEGQFPEGARLFGSKSLEPSGPMQSGMFPYEFEGKVYDHPTNGYGVPRAGMDRLKWARRLISAGKLLRYALFAEDKPVADLTHPWTDTVGARDKVYVVQTNVEVVRRCILMTTDPGDLVLDPTCGSGTTAYVAEQWGRRWITADTSRVALALARTRLMSARYPYYLLADSPEGLAKEAELTGVIAPLYQTQGDIKKGFVYERVPHVTVTSIANNPEITEGMARDDIEAAIRKRAEVELLYDYPYDDAKRVRVTGPFTVESLSPHRVLATDEERPASEVAGRRDPASEQFETMVIANLRKAGIQGTTKGQRIKFEKLDLFAGTWLQAAGEYEESGERRRVAISIGPEHGTVGPLQVKEAAKEAVKGVGFDTLVVCGFAFDPHVAEEAKRYGKLTVLAARMNPDLAMGDELLKKTGAANLFMVFGEPDLKVETAKDGMLSIEIRGVDVYDPTTGEIRSSSTDDIACWFIDSDYNGESFFVRHAYFTGADEPYEKLQRALRAEIDEVAWRSLYSTKSRWFGRPSTGKIAVKVINHYGDEVLKVFSV